MKRMKIQFSRLKEKPLLTSLIGWLLFPGMYVLVGIFTFFGVSVETSFIMAAPAGVLGFFAWVSAFAFSLIKLYQGQHIPASLVALISSLVPLGFLLISFWAVINGATV